MTATAYDPESGRNAAAQAQCQSRRGDLCLADPREQLLSSGCESHRQCPFIFAGESSFCQVENSHLANGCDQTHKPLPQNHAPLCVASRQATHNSLSTSPRWPERISGVIPRTLAKASPRAAS